uniref:Uncharacterized protein LOC114348402 n=1 Tax=Diabrotica virgifera virgifera TaxID=50390 RepID=A0A6P7HAS5_DIAVI
MSCQKRYFSESGIDNFVMSLMLEDWNQVYGILDTNLAFNVFVDIFSYYFNIHFPLQNKRIINTRKKWVNTEVLLSSSNLKNLHVLSRSCPCLREYYKLEKKKHQKLLCLTKKNYYQNIISLSDNPTKSAWRLVADVTNNVDNNGRKNICLKSDENCVIEECPIVANMFNVFFKNASIEIRSKIPSHQNSTLRKPPYNENENFLQLCPYTPNELNYILTLQMS